MVESDNSRLAVRTGDGLDEASGRRDVTAAAGVVRRGHRAGCTNHSTREDSRRMPKLIAFNEEARRGLERGMNTLADAVKVTCYEGIDASQALYDWDFPRQILHLRTVETTSQEVDVETVERSLFDERFLLARPVLRALRESPAVLLVDEIDRADDEFEAFLLEVLSTHQVTIPELGTVTAAAPPVVVLTSNRTREVHDALKRRCLYHWIDHPGLEREVAIVRSRLPEVSRRLAEQVTRSVQRMRTDLDLLKPPGVAETLDWTRAVTALGKDHLDVQTAAVTLGAVLKYREDADRVRDHLDRLLAS